MSILEVIVLVLWTVLCFIFVWRFDRWMKKRYGPNFLEEAGWWY